MVSKTVLSCLALLACLSMTSGTGADVNFGYCVTGVSYINKKFSLGFVIKNILGGVLNLVGNIVDGVLGLVGSILGGGVFSASKVPFIAAPNNILSLAGVNVGVGPVFGKLLAPSFGSDFDINIFSDVHGALSINLLNLLQIDIGSAPSSLKNAISLELAAKKAAAISALLNGKSFKSGQWAAVAALIRDYLSSVSVAAQKQISVDLYAQATIKYIKIQIALLTMAGFPSVNEYVNAQVQTCNSVFSQIGYSRSISASDFNVNVPYNCNCFGN